ncbi:MAG: hypothetical protein PHH77_05185 [Victivallaceae bacterium]|nr:hypothetical protein [Victivallaceae bacterium]
MQKNFRQPELPCKPMVEAELPGMPEKPPVPLEPKLSDETVTIIKEVAKACARNFNAMKVFCEEINKVPGKHVFFGGVDFGHEFETEPDGAKWLNIN